MRMGLIGPCSIGSWRPGRPLMPLAFSASQALQLPVQQNADRLGAYLDDEEQVIEALLEAQQLSKIAPGRYRYTVTKLQVFQL